MTATIERFGSEESPGEFLWLQNGEYIHSEWNESNETILWSTTDNAPQAVEAFLKRTGWPPFNSSGLIILSNPSAQGDIAEGPSADVCDYVLKTTEADYQLIRIDFDAFRIWWRSPGDNLRTDSSPQLWECGLSSSSPLDYDLILSSVEATASDGLKSHITALLEQLAHYKDRQQDDN